MDAPVIIRTDGLGKRYRIRHQRRERYTALRDVISEGVRTMFRGKGPAEEQEVEDFWALRDVSFEVKRGEVMGVIGRNGAGKSTLLKILSRITDPTSGRVTIAGRVASLLEVGTGFHPELTGRENIYLNGAILGMSRAEIRSKFDAIVEFAEVEKFLDTPVKRYSSGMYVRLAFAVAAHMEPEILVVDEVLAVGDAEFQKKCLGKMQEVSTGGRTVLFVSHQMAAVQNLCQTGLLLSAGRVVEKGPIDAVVSRYLREANQLAEISLDGRKDRQGTGALRFAAVSLRDRTGQMARSLASGEAGTIEIELRRPTAEVLRNVRFAIGIDSDVGQRILVLATNLAHADFAELGPECRLVRVHVPRLSLAPGRYGFTLFSTVGGEVADWIKNAGSFDVDAGDFYGNGQMPPPGQGFMLLEHEFEAC